MPERVTPGTLRQPRRPPPAPPPPPEPPPPHRKTNHHPPPPLPPPLAARVRILPRQAIGQRHAGQAAGAVAIELRANLNQMRPELGRNLYRQRRHPILPALAPPHGNRAT